MKKTKSTTIEVHGTSVTILSSKDGDYISLTDMLQAKDGEFFISDWLRNRNTVEFLGIWESVFNPGFNYGEFAIIKSQVGLNSYKISVKEWVEKTHAIGLKATAGRYGGTFAHPDIAFEFGMWISPEFKIYLVKEFRRLKEDENRRLSLAWNLNRTLSKLNYRIHTDAIKAHLIPPEVTPAQAAITYAHATLFEGEAEVSRTFHFRGQVEGLRSFEASHGKFLVLGTLDSPEDWLLRELQAEGAHLRYMGNYDTSYKT